MSAAEVPGPVAAVLDGAPSLFLSPHLDDAVLSCGVLLGRAATAGRATVATVFSAAAPGPHTRAARSFLRQCTATGAEELFAARRAEDVEVVRAAGAEPVHLGRRDALFRTRRGPAGVLRRVAAVAPELTHRYPTFRFDIARGRVAAAEHDLAGRIVDQVAELVAGTRAQVVFCPLGVGRHVDHLLVRAVGPLLGDRVVYYADFPYVERCRPEPAFLAAHRLRRWVCPDDPTLKRPLIEGYRTQVGALFPDGRIPARAEEYYTAG
ncbi:MAG TPA: PIG-L family deacetylase [Pseudonocardia sp.]|nr:PIG-L family deacetylase [Pseudonocardia sp.]